MTVTTVRHWANEPQQVNSGKPGFESNHPESHIVVLSHQQWCVPSCQDTWAMLGVRLPIGGRLHGQLAQHESC